MPSSAETSELSRAEFYREAAGFMYANQPDFDADTFETMFSLVSAYDAFASRINRRLHRFNLSLAAFNMLMILNQPVYRETGCRLSQLGRLLLVSKANITGVMDSLVKRGLAERVDATQDRRVKLAKTTPAGEALFAVMLPGHFQTTRRLLKGLKRAEKRSLRDLLIQFRQSVESAGEEPDDETQG